MSSPYFSEPPRDLLFALSRAILFEMDPERAHDMALSALSRCTRPAFMQRWLRKRYQGPTQTIRMAGLTLSSPIGLAAGLDKNGDYIDALGCLGFGHLEIGTVTPRPQSGNPRPRLFRLSTHQGLINRMGFNNKGVDYLVERVRQRRYSGCLGINIGKNADTPLAEAASDYLHCLERVYAHADYITVNISSPNTRGLRDLQHGDALQQLLDTLKNAQARLVTTHARHVPVLIKIAPDMDDIALDATCSALEQHDIEGVIIGNTTQDRSAVASHLYAREAGGLSGAPLLDKANNRLRAVTQRLNGKMAVIGVGGVNCGQDAAHKLSLGADAVQLYSGLIYHGPALVRDCTEATYHTSIKQSVDQPPPVNH